MLLINKFIIIVISLLLLVKHIIFYKLHRAISNISIWYCS